MSSPAIPSPKRVLRDALLTTATGGASALFTTGEGRQTLQGGLRSAGKAIGSVSETVGEGLSPTQPAPAAPPVKSTAEIREEERIKKLADLRSQELKRGNTGRRQTILTSRNELPSLVG